MAKIVKEKIDILVEKIIHPETNKTCWFATCPSGKIQGQTFAYTREVLENISLPELLQINIDNFKARNTYGLDLNPEEYDGFDIVYK